jgi:hypothetical protein
VDVEDVVEVELDVVDVIEAELDMVDVVVAFAISDGIAPTI